MRCFTLVGLVLGSIQFLIGSVLISFLGISYVTAAIFVLLPILLTGGLLRFPDVEAGIRRRCGFIAPIATYPGEMEQEAMAYPALRVLKGELVPNRYSGRNVWNGFGDIDL